MLVDAVLRLMVCQWATPQGGSRPARDYQRGLTIFCSTIPVVHHWCPPRDTVRFSQCRGSLQTLPGPPRDHSETSSSSTTRPPWPTTGQPHEHLLARHCIHDRRWLGEAAHASLSSCSTRGTTGLFKTATRYLQDIYLISTGASIDILYRAGLGCVVMTPFPT